MAKLNQYEAMFLFPPAGTMDQQACIDLARGIVERHNGQVIVIKKWDERRLAYEIGKQKRGLYVICYFRAEGGAVATIERDVKLSEEVLRVMITSADHLNEEEMAAVEPQPIAPPREERPSWEGDSRPRRRREERDERDDKEESSEPADASAAE